MARHWQRRACLVRAAITGFERRLGRAELIALACRDDIESRLVVRTGTWSLARGPFRARDFRALPPAGWTLLVQGVNLVVPEADRLMRRFDFVPFARLDDVMVSYAVPGGGVGPHFDSYDVFLLQGIGERRWRISRQRDLSLEPDLPLAILRRFRPEHEWVLSPGDMLYLPPKYAHDGVALSECTTWSIGFRAPSAQELGVGWLAHLQDTLALPGRFADPGARACAEPALLAKDLVDQARRLVSALAPPPGAFAAFLGAWLTEPKAHVVFERPAPPLSRRRFEASARRSGIALDAKTQLLYDSRYLYLNGESLRWPRGGADALRRLANTRTLRVEARTAVSLLDLLYGWYRDGFLRFGS